MPEADKIYGKFLPETIDPPERVCFVIEIPDTLQYRAALMGQLEWLADWRCWEHTQADYENPPARNLEAAQLFAYAVTEGRFDECGVMSCDDVQDCIETDAGVQSAIQGMINQSESFPATYPYGQNLPTSATTRDMAAGTNPGCDLDILWSQCLGIVQNTNLAIVDVLEKVEVSANVVELANSLLQAVPVLGTAKDVLGISGAVELINYYQEAVLEGYNAQYTTTPGGVQDQIACAIFCACKADCQITIDRVVGVLQDRLSVYVAPPSLEGFVNFVETLAGINQDTTFVVDLAFFTAWGLIKVANFFFGQRFNDTLDVIIALMADEPNNDWEILCEDCPGETCYEWDFTATDGGFVNSPGLPVGSVWSSGLGWTDDGNFGVGFWGVDVEKTFTGQVAGANKIEFDYDFGVVPATPSAVVIAGFVGGIGGSIVFNYLVNPSGQSGTYTQEQDFPNFDTLLIEAVSDDNATSPVVSRLQVMGDASILTYLTGGGEC